MCNKKESSTCTNEDQMHEGIEAQRNKRTKKQSHQPWNKNCSNTLYTVHKLIAHWTGWEVWVRRNFLQGWLVPLDAILSVCGRGSRI
jgi:hypothetical protein